MQIPALAPLLAGRAAVGHHAAGACARTVPRLGGDMQSGDDDGCLTWGLACIALNYRAQELKPDEKFKTEAEEAG